MVSSYLPGVTCEKLIPIWAGLPFPSHTILSPADSPTAPTSSRLAPGEGRFSCVLWAPPLTILQFSKETRVSFICLFAAAADKHPAPRVVGVELSTEA